MNPKAKTILIVLLVLIVPAALVYGGYKLYISKKNSEDKKSEDRPYDADENNPTNTTSGKANESFPLKYNASVSTSLVKSLQERLNTRLTGLLEPVVPYVNGSPVKELKVDGYYGEKTAAVVKYLFPSTDGKTVTENMYNNI